MLVSITATEQATGLDREVFRKWERRYGFPRPVRDANGEREYPEDQVIALCLIRRLMDAGFRPAKVVGLDLTALQILAESLLAVDEGRDRSFEDEALAILRRHDVEGLTIFFQRYISQQGILSFVQDKIALLNVAIGDGFSEGTGRDLAAPNGDLDGRDGCHTTAPSPTACRSDPDIRRCATRARRSARLGNKSCLKWAQ